MSSMRCSRKNGLCLKTGDLADGCCNGQNSQTNHDCTMMIRNFAIEHLDLTNVPMPSPSLQAKLLVRKTLYMSIAALLRWARLIDAIIGLDAKSPWLDGLVVTVSESTISQVWGAPSVGLPLPREPKTHEIVGSAGKKMVKGRYWIL